MQYILTEEEMKNFVPLKKHTDELMKIGERLVKAEKIIMDKNDFKCIHDYEDKSDRYCDDCPLGFEGIDTCTKNKNYSK